MKKQILLLLLFIVFKSNAQIGIGTSTPHASAALEIKDTTKGILIPRMKMQNRVGIFNPSEGLMVYQTDNAKGFWYFNGNEWKSVAVADNNGGKHSLVLSGPITDAQAVAKIARDVGPNTQEIIIRDCSKLTAVDLGMVTGAVAVSVTNNPSLKTVNLNGLTECYGSFLIDKCPLLTNLDLTSLETISTNSNIDFVTITDNGLKTLSFPALKESTCTINIISSNLVSVDFPVLTSITSLQISGYIVGSALSSISCPMLDSIINLQVSGCTQLTSISFPSLRVVDGINISGNDNLSSVSLNSLQTVGNKIQLNSNSLLGSISFVNLKHVGSFEFGSDSSLTAISFPALTTLSAIESNSEINNCKNFSSISFDNLSNFNNRGFVITKCKIPSSIVNYILSQFVAINPTVTGKTISMYNQIPPAPPTGQGLTDKATLIGAGNIVNVF